jgi:heavy metal translocating P-type ATPase
MLKKIRHFFKHYRGVGLVTFVMLASGALYLTGNRTIANFLMGGTSIIAVIPLTIDMARKLRVGSYGVDVLATTAILTAVILGEFWAAIIIVLMLTGGESLEDYAKNRAKTELTELLRRKPKKAHLIKGDKTIDVSAKDVKVGDRLKIFLGEVVPADCEVIEGESLFDESSLTGESLPVDKQPGDHLLSGSVNTGGVVTVRALQTAADSQYEQIIKLVKAAAASQSPFVRMADRYAIPFTSVAFIIAGTAWIISGEAGRFLEVLVVATPCPLILGAPIALMSGMSRSAKYGIIVKNGSTLEKLADIETMAFDKTGTLTKGTPSIHAISTYNGFTEDEILTYAASLEQNSNHVLAKAIVDTAVENDVKLQSAKQIKELAGLGVSGRFKGKSIQVGNLSMLQDIELPKKFKASSERTSAYVAVNGRLAGMVTFHDEIRPEAESMLSRLKKMGIKHTLMITGDNEATAKSVARNLGISQVKAECLPGDKILAIEKVPHRPVAFVGDGVNDAPVLTASDVGIALGASGSAAASESADVVIMQDDIGKVAGSVEIAQRTFSIARQSVLIGIFISLGLMAIFSTGRFTAIQGALAQEVVDIIVIFNALRAHTVRIKV